MSRFFLTYASDTSDEDEEDNYFSSSSSSAEQSADEEQTSQTQQKKSVFSKYLQDSKYGSDSGSDSEDRRVVKSGKDKFIEEITNFKNSIGSFSAAKDYVQLLTEFEKLTKFINQQHKKYDIPKFYYHILVDLENFVQVENSQDKKKLDSFQAKALNTFTQKLKKYNKGYQQEIEDAKSNPIPDYSQQKSELQQEQSAAKNRFFKSTDSDKDDDEDEASSDEEETAKETASGANRWKKSTALDPGASIKKNEKKAKAVAFAKKEGEDSQLLDTSGETKPVTEITAESVYTKLREIMDARGKKGTDRLEEIAVLEKILKVASSPTQKTKVLLALISARFDFGSSSEMWNAAQIETEKIFEILENNNDIRMQESGEEYDEETIKKSSDEGYKIVRGNPVSLVIRLDEDFLKNLQSADPNTNEYVEHLKDEIGLYCLILRAEVYCDKIKDSESLSRLRMLRLEHIYYKYNNVIMMMESTARKSNSNLGELPTDADSLVHNLCVYLYHNAGDRIRTRSVLCHVYHHALNQRFKEARDLFLMSHLQETIQRADISTQVLYNRALAQIGICAFRSGFVKETHNALNDIMGSLKTKDILAQGTQLQRYQNTEVDKKEKQRLLPFHMHINLELLEAIQLTVSMLIEIPLLASNAHDSKKKIVSKHFRRLLDFADKQIFSGPPENFKDSIMEASRSLSNGDWRRATELICSISSWDLLPNASSVRKMLTETIKEEGLRTFLFTNGAYYDNVGVAELSEAFDLPTSKVTSIVNKMIYNDELKATMEEHYTSIKMQQSEITKFQFLTQQLCEKVGAFIEGNEKLVDLKYSQGGRKQQQQQQQQQQNQ